MTMEAIKIGVWMRGRISEPYTLMREAITIIASAKMLACQFGDV